MLLLLLRLILLLRCCCRRRCRRCCCCSSAPIRFGWAKYTCRFQRSLSPSPAEESELQNDAISSTTHLPTGASQVLGAAFAIVRGAILAHSFCRKSSHAGSSDFGVLHVLHLIRDGQFLVLHALHAHDQRRVRCHFGSASASGSSLDTNFRQVGQHKKANCIWRQNFL